MSRLRWWTVVSPEYGTVVPVTDWGEGPLEYGRDVVYVQAEDPREAKLLGFATMRQLCRRGWVDGCGDDFRDAMSGDWEVIQGRI